MLDVSSWAVVEEENSGGDEKLWLADGNEQRWLFKPLTENEGWVTGEDWAEVVACELARRLGLPAAHAELAVRTDRRGALVRTIRPQGWELQHGALLLAERVPGYELRGKERVGHSLDRIEEVLEAAAPPEGFEEMTAFEVFAGYLVLDALIANQDRHEENWAVLRPLPDEGPLRLAPSYDHGSSLGFNLTDQARRKHLDEGTLEKFASKARAQRFEKATDGSLTLVELAEAALARCRAPAEAHWKHALRRVSDDDLCFVVADIPNLSDPARRFATDLLIVNRGRLLA